MYPLLLQYIPLIPCLTYCVACRYDMVALGLIKRLSLI